MPSDFAYFLYVRDLPELRGAAYGLEARLRVAGDIVGADIVKGAYTKLIGELEVLSAEISALGTDILREHERKSRVRPDSGRSSGLGVRLADHLSADPLSLQLPGSVGIANETALDANVPWWSTNEEGSSARVGAKLYGTFEPGGWIPSQSMSGQHPIFEVKPSESGEGGWMTVKKPIPARRFILHSIPEIEAAWIAGFNSIKSSFMARVAAASVVP